MKSKKISFKNRDGVTLSARLEMPVTHKPQHFAIFAHCFTCSKDLRAVRNIADGLTNKGFGLLRFDFTGLGQSEGDFSETNFSSQVSDLLSACSYMKENHKPPVLMIGHSLGGTAALIAASELPDLRAVATIGSPADPLHVKHLIESDIDEIKSEGKAKVTIAGRSFTIKSQFLEDLEKNSIKNRLKKLKKSLLILHSPQDRIVSIGEAEKIYTAAMHPKSFVSLDGADHLLSREEDGLYTGELIASWAKRYLDHKSDPVAESTEGTWVRLGDEEDKFTTQIQMGKHSLMADEPRSAGGYDYGPSPYDLLNASLGSCTAMTLRMYANHKKWDLKEVRIHLQHEKKHVSDAENTDKNEKLDHITRTIELDGDLDDKQKKRMLEIADKCPVHKSLTQTIVIESRLK